VPAEVVRRVLQRFNDGQLGVVPACEALGIGKSRLYELRHQWLRQPEDFVPGVSGGDRSKRWSSEAEQLACGLLTSGPPNYALVADELGRRLGVRRSRSAVGRYVRRYWPDLANTARPGRKSWRRWQCEVAGGIWQHDSTPIQPWESQPPCYLLLTVDDCTRQIVGISLVEHETLWAHFLHLRRAFQRHGIPELLYTDGLSLFGHGGDDHATRCGRALHALGIAHRIAPTPQAKGKIERQIGTFQRRVEPLLIHESIGPGSKTDILLDDHADYWNEHHVHAALGLTPNAALAQAQAQDRCVYRPCPPSALLDLHLAWIETRRVCGNTRIQYQGRSWLIATTHLSRVWLVIHPGTQFWVIAAEPDPRHPAWPEVLAHFRLRGR